MQIQCKKTIAAVAAFIIACILLAGNADPVHAQESEQGISLTIYDYDWTAYCQDYADAQKTTGTGEKDPSWDETKKKYALHTVTFAMIKVADMGDLAGNVEGAAMYDVTYKLEPEVKNLLFKDSTQTNFTAAELNEALQKAGSKAEIEAYAKNPSTKVYATLITDANGMVKIDLPPEDKGVYLIVQTHVSENVNVTMDPFLVTLPMAKADGSAWNYDVHVYPKNQTSIPEVKKLVKNDTDTEFSDSTSVTPGDKIQYNLVASIPEVTTDSTKFKTFNFTDHIPKGFECETEVVDGKVVLAHPEEVHVRIYDTKDDAWQQADQNYIELVYGEDYTLVYHLVKDGSSSIDVVLTVAGLEKLNANGTGSKYMTVTYPVIVGDTDQVAVGDDGNRSDVTLTYGRTASTEADSSDVVEQEVEDAAIVLTYGLEIKKTFDVKVTDAETIKQVQFVIQNKSNKKYLQGELRDKQILGNYKITNSTTERNEATLFSPDMEGNLNIDGIQADEYEITEVKTVSGYALLKDPILVQIFAREFLTQPTTAAHAGQNQQITTIGITNVHGREKATAKVNGVYTDINEEGRVPRIKMTILNKKENAANVVSNIINKLTPATGDTSQIYISLIGFAASLAVIIVILKKRKE